MSKRELRKILDQVLREIEEDPEAAARVRGAAAPLSLEFTDLKLALAIERDEGGSGLRWKFSKRPAEAKVRLAMTSDVANRLFQGRENPAIAMARGRVRPQVDDAGAALRFFPAAKPIFSRYRAIVAEKYPHLTLD